MDHSKKLSRSVNIGYSAIQGSFISSVGVLFGFVTVLLQSKNFDNTQIGITMAIGSATCIFTPTLLAEVSSRYKKAAIKHIIAFVLLISVAAAVLLIFVDSPIPLVMLIFIVTMVFSNSSMPLINALAMQFENIGVQVNYGVARGIGSLGYAVLGYITGCLVDKMGAGILLPLYVLIMCITIVIILLFNRPDKTLANEAEPREEKKEKKASVWSIFYRNPAALFFMFAMMCISLNHGTLDTFQVSIIKSVGGNNADYGTLMLVMAVSEIPTMFLFNTLSKRFSYTRLMSVGYIAFAVKDIALILAPNVAMVIGVQVLNMFSLGLYIPAGVYLVNSMVDQDRAVQAQAIIGFGGMGMGLGRIIGNYVGGILIDESGLYAMLIFSAVSVLIGFVLLQFASILRKKALTNAHL